MYRVFGVWCAAIEYLRFQPRVCVILMVTAAQYSVSPKRPWRLGWGYADGKLSVFGTRDIVVMRGWPAPMAWRRTKTKPWRHNRKHADEVFRHVLWKLDLLPDSLDLDPVMDDTHSSAPGEKLPFDLYYQTKILPQERAMAQEFLGDTPQDVLTELARHTDRHWHLYCLFARCPGAVELANEHPALAYALASCWVFHKPIPSKPMRAIRSLLRKPVPAIWEWLGFPVNPIALGMYGWLESRGLTIKRLLDYRTAMRKPAAQQFIFNLGPLEWECLELAITPWIARMITGELIQDVAQSKAWDLNWAEQVKESLKYIRMIEKNCEIPELPRFDRAAQVFEFRNHFETMNKGGFLTWRQK